MPPLSIPTYHMQFHIEGSDYDDYDYAAEQYTLSVPIRQVPNGAVCLFGGHYILDRDALTVMRVIPTEHCIISANKGIDRSERCKWLTQ